MYCPNCGKEIQDDCGFCSSCGADVNAPPRPNYQYVLPLKSAGLAAVLSVLFTGLGQIYLGKIGRGLLIILGSVSISAVMTLFAVTTYDLVNDPDAYNSGIVPAAITTAALIILIVYWVWQIYDAYKLANKYNEEIQAGNRRPW